MGSLIIAASLLTSRRRKCSACGHTQLTSVFAVKQSVDCRHCGAKIPPAPLTPIPKGRSDR